nr:calcium-binding protein 39-like [Meriones unguiculatus]
MDFRLCESSFLPKCSPTTKTVRNPPQRSWICCAMSAGFTMDSVLNLLQAGKHKTLAFNLRKELSSAPHHGSAFCCLDKPGSFYSPCIPYWKKQFLYEKKMPLFSKSHKNPVEIVKILKDNLAILEKQDKKSDKASEEVSKSLQAMKEILCGTNDKEPPTEAVAQLAQELYSSGLLVTLIADLQLIDFEGKKDVTQIFNNILRRQIGTRYPTVEYISSHPHLLSMLLKG